MKKLSLLIFLITIAFSSYAQKAVIQLEPITKLNYLITKTKNDNTKTPLLILLHGYGSNEQDLFELSAQLPSHFLIVSVRAPIQLNNNSYAWYNIDFENNDVKYNYADVQKSTKLLVEFIASLKKKYSFDKNQIYFLGFSQGAILSYDVALTNPKLLKGIVAMSGRIPVETNSPTYNDLSKLNIFISHGNNDKVIGIQKARIANEKLRKAGLTTTYKEYNDGHTINTQMLNDVIAWLNSKTK